MIANTLTAVLSVLVVTGVTLQFVAASGLGVRIVRRKLARRAAPTPVPRAAVTPAPRPTARRRCRDYRLALRGARANAA